MALKDFIPGPDNFLPTQLKDLCDALMHGSATYLMNPRFNASGSAVTTTLASGATSGASSISVVSSATFKKDQGIFIAGAGAAGANYIGTITAISGNTISISPNISTTVSSGAKVQHDDTAAMNAAVAAAIASGESSTIIVRKGRYRINGPLQGASGHQSRIPLQYHGAATAKSIAIKGEVQIGQLIGTVPGIGQQPTTDASIFESESDGGAIFGGEWVGGAAGGFTMMAVEFDRIVIRNKDNPTQHGIDGELMFALIVRNCVIDTGKYTTDCAQPTTTGITGVIMPTVNNNFPDVFENNGISGYDRGLIPGEHTVGVGHSVIAACNSAVYFKDNQFHDCCFDRLLVFNSTKILDFAGRAMVTIKDLDIEHANSAGLGTPSWQDTTTDINDPSNLARGEVRWHVVKGGVGISDAFVQSGAFYLRTPQIRNSTGGDALTGAGGLLLPYLQLHNSGDISCTDSTLTNITFDTDFQDLWGMHSTSSNTHRIVPTKAGIITIDLALEFAANSTGWRQVRLIKHRAVQADDVVLKIVQTNAATSPQPTLMDITTIAVAVSPGDYFYFQAMQNSGGSLNITTQNFYSPLLNAKID